MSPELLEQRVQAAGFFPLTELIFVRVPNDDGVRAAKLQQLTVVLSGPADDQVKRRDAQRQVVVEPRSEDVTIVVNVS